MARLKRAQAEEVLKVTGERLEKADKEQRVDHELLSISLPQIVADVYALDPDYCLEQFGS